MSIKLPGVKTGTIDSFTNSGDRIKWSPKSELTLVASAPVEMPKKIAANPSRRQSGQAIRSGNHGGATEAARIFVGYNVAKKPTWRSGEVYLATYLLREAQLLKRKKGFPAFSFYVGWGAFPGDVKVSSEQSAVVEFINFTQSQAVFFDDMNNLAADLAEFLHQEAVLLELSKGGRQTYMDYVDADEDQFTEVDTAKATLTANKDYVSPSIWKMK